MSWLIKGMKSWAALLLSANAAAVGYGLSSPAPPLINSTHQPSFIQLKEIKTIQSSSLFIESRKGKQHETKTIQELLK